MSETVTCAAVLTKKGEAVRGRRHHNCIQAIVAMGEKVDRRSEAQGFITTTGRFVTREEARKLQDAAGIQSVADGGYRGNTLFSEDLY